jgi:hypothetical protein
LNSLVSLFFVCACLLAGMWNMGFICQRVLSRSCTIWTIFNMATLFGKKAKLKLRLQEDLTIWKLGVRDLERAFILILWLAEPIVTSISEPFGKKIVTNSMILKRLSNVWKKILFKIFYICHISVHCFQVGSLKMYKDVLGFFIFIFC